MTLITPVAPQGPPEDFTSEALVLYKLASDVLAAIIEEMKASADDRTVRELGAYTKEHRAALQILLNERANVEKLRRSAAATADDTSLDLDAARDEIGRRLARLRDAGGGE